MSRTLANIDSQSKGNTGRSVRSSDVLRTVVLLHDDSLVMRGALQALESSGQLFAVTGVRSAAEVNRLLVTRSGGTDILIVALPDGPDPAYLAQLSAWARSALVLTISRAADPHLLCALVDAGVHGHLDSDVEPGALFAALNMIARGRFLLSGSARSELFRMTSGASERPAPQPVPAVLGELTEREGQVLALVAEGWTHKEISSRLGLSKATVDTYVQRIRQKLGLRNKAELTRVALQYGISDGIVRSDAGR